MVYLVTRVGGRSGYRLRYGLFEKKRQILLYHLSAARKDVATEERNLNLAPVVEIINMDFFKQNYENFTRWQSSS